MFIVIDFPSFACLKAESLFIHFDPSRYIIVFMPFPRGVRVWTIRKMLTRVKAKKPMITATKGFASQHISD